MILATPKYGPGWSYKIQKVSPFVYRLLTLHDPQWHRNRIRVAPWNRKQIPKRVGREDR